MYKSQIKEMIYNEIPSDKLAIRIREQIEEGGGQYFYNDEDADNLVDWLAGRMADEGEPDPNEG